jgi:hypothetical protein
VLGVALGPSATSSVHQWEKARAAAQAAQDDTGRCWTRTRGLHWDSTRLLHLLGDELGFTGQFSPTPPLATDSDGLGELLGGRWARLTGTWVSRSGVSWSTLGGDRLGAAAGRSAGAVLAVLGPTGGALGELGAELGEAWVSAGSSGDELASTLGELLGATLEHRSG